MIPNKDIIKRLEDIGRVQQMLKVVLEHEIFSKISKHNPYWDSEHEEESDKLYDLRMAITSMSQALWEIMTVLKQESPDEFE